MLLKRSNLLVCNKALHVIIVASIALSAFATPELNKQVSVLTDKAVPSTAKVNVLNLKSNNFEQKKDTTSKTKNTTDPIIVKDIQIKKAFILIDGKSETYETFQKLNPNDIESFSVLKDKTAKATYGENGKNGVLIITTKNASQEEKVFDVVEQMPVYPGGISGLMQYLSENVKYPVAVQENGIQGRVVVSFVVEKNGSISDPKVVMSNADFINATPEEHVIGYEQMSDEEKSETKEKYEQIRKSAKESLNAEAIRVVSSMPNWTPGMNAGKPVRVKYNIPISFRLQ